MMSTAVWPSSWNCRSFRSGTVWPRWTSKPVGSMPYLTRSGLPVAAAFELLAEFVFGHDAVDAAADEGELLLDGLHDVRSRGSTAAEANSVNVIRRTSSE